MAGLRTAQPRRRGATHAFPGHARAPTAPRLSEIAQAGSPHVGQGISEALRKVSGRSGMEVKANLIDPLARGSTRHRLISLEVSRQRGIGAGHGERVARRRADQLPVLGPIDKAVTAVWRGGHRD